MSGRFSGRRLALAALRDRQPGRLQDEIIYPASTILSERTVVTCARDISAANRPLVEAFTRFHWSDRAQPLFVEAGFRSVDESYNSAFRAVLQPFRVADLGAWPRARSEMIEQIWKNQVLAVLGQ